LKKSGTKKCAIWGKKSAHEERLQEKLTFGGEAPANKPSQAQPNKLPQAKRRCITRKFRKVVRNNIINSCVSEMPDG